MKIAARMLLAAGVLSLPGSGLAQDFGVTESAETVSPHNFKLKFNPLVVFGRNGEDSMAGTAALGGIALGPRVDLEGGVSFYADTTFLGANVEAWLVRTRSFDFSIAGGFHRRFVDQAEDFNGIDATFIASGHVARRLELYGGLDFAIEGLGGDADFCTAHLVPGLEFRINPSIDFVVETGIALNNEARHYISGGLAFYIR